MSECNKEQFSHPTISWGSSVLPVQVQLLSLIQQTPGMGTCNNYGCSDSYSIVVDFTVWKRWLQNTCELNEPCRCWNDIDGGSVCISLNLKKVNWISYIKNPFRSSVFAWNRFGSCNGSAIFFSYKNCWFGKKRFGEKKKKECYDYCYLFLESSLHHLTSSRRNKSCLGKTAFSPIWTSFFL